MWSTIRPNTNLILRYLGGTEHYLPAVSIPRSSREQTAIVRHCSKCGNPSGCNVLARDRESGHSPRYHPYTARAAMTLCSNFAGNVLPIHHEACTFRRLKNHFAGTHSNVTRRWKLMQTLSLYFLCNSPTAITLLGQTTQSLHRVSEGSEGLTVTDCSVGHVCHSCNIRM
jgi:hypothetical protein